MNGGLCVIFVRHQVGVQCVVAGQAPSGYLLRRIDSSHKYIVFEYEGNLETFLNQTGRVGSIRVLEFFLPEVGTILS